MKKATQKILGAIAVLVMVSGCSTTGTRRAPPPVEHTSVDAQQFVDDQMGQTLVSIDKSLRTLLMVSRGGEPARIPSPISDTVAGADVHGAPPPRPPLKPVVATRHATGCAVPNTPGCAPAPVSASATELASRSRVDWAGDPRDLLREVSRGIGYTYSETGARQALPRVTLKRNDASVTDVLSDLARAVQGKADIRVSTTARTIELVYR